MSLADFQDMMTETVMYAASVGRSTYGAVLFGSAVSYKARIVRTPSKIRQADGSDILAKGHVWLAVFVDVGPDDQLTFPDGSNPPVLRVDKWVDELNSRYVKIYFG